MTDKIKIGISTCLLGENVRYNGGNSHDRYLTGTLGEFVEYVPVCPEAECGMGIPRESVRLVGDPDNPRMMTTRTKIDKTDQMQSWITTKLKVLEEENLCGFIFKSKSPSSGLYRIKVYDEKGNVRSHTAGMFAKAFTERFPGVPVEEDGRLHDMRLRENFIEKLFTLKRWREILGKGKTLGNLVVFHTQNKLLLLSHHQDGYRNMGKLVADGKQYPLDELYESYETVLLKTLDYKTTAKKNINVLHHMVGYFKKQLTSDEKVELLETIERYRDEHVPLLVPLTLIRHYARKYNTDYLLKQTYIEPHPAELRLRAFL